jgi:DNA-binding NarL/FixJ family response regulator
MRILIADDNDRVRRGLAELLSSEANWEICGQAKDGPEALRMARELLPDVILIDISMPGVNGLQATPILRQKVPAAKILVISQHDPIQLLPRVVAAGAHGCVAKSRLSTVLLPGSKSLCEQPTEAQ